ncbi:SDR family NAD(P)-dependent oxidoreductase [Actinoallomurus sp. CA-150999]|uniref:SDR family NAD(P)-dependent oxidoreductase n=1 Tax=Actinoallomurus sp. CA-150999 TaxID=3239887 RepID=UPI003D8FAD90
MDLGLSDKTVLVTGATGGIGEAIARAYAAEGARVAVTYHLQAGEADRLADELGGRRGRAFAVRYALSDPDSHAAALAAVADRWGHGPDVLVANAVRWGSRPPRATAFPDVPGEEWSAFVVDNLSQTIRTVQVAVPAMQKRGWGRIVLLSSHLSRDGGHGMEFYGAVKAGLEGFARSLAWDVGTDGVLVNVVRPGVTLTGRVRARLPEEARAAEVSRTPSGRLSDPEDVAGAVLFLGSAANRNITGEVLTVSGGR